MTGIDLIEDPELLAEVKSSWSAEVARRSAVS
jgi:hypothetical protein